MYITDILQRGRLLQEDTVHTMTQVFTLVIVFICIVLALRLTQYSKNTLLMCQANTPKDDLTVSSLVQHSRGGLDRVLCILDNPLEDLTEVSSMPQPLSILRSVGLTHPQEYFCQHPPVATSLSIEYLLN